MDIDMDSLVTGVVDDFGFRIKEGGIRVDRTPLPKCLGDEGLGTYSLFFVAVLVAGGVGNLGIGLGNVYFLN